MPKSKPTWGGRRPNQTGRPASRQGALRVHLTASIDPLTDAYLREQAKLKSESIGRVIDGLVPADPAKSKTWAEQYSDLQKTQRADPAEPVDPAES